MKKMFALFILLISLNQINAQVAEAVFFTDNGERFVAYIDGLQLNRVADMRVKAVDLTQEFARLRVVFDNPSMGEFTANIALAPGKEVTYLLKQNNKGKWVPRYQSEGPLGTTSVLVSETGTIQREEDLRRNALPTNDQTITTTTTQHQTQGNGSVGISFNVNINETNQGIQTGIQVNDGKESIRMNTGTHVNVNGTDANGLQMNINVNDGLGGNLGTQTTVTETRTVRSTSGTESQSQRATPASTCKTAMASNDFNAAINTIKNQSFEDTKMTTAKQISDNNCLNVNQIIQIMALFSFEESKLNFAKHAYRRVLDPGQYFKINDSFSFSSSIDDLDSFMRANPR
jgi:hypothetical protein